MINLSKILPLNTQSDFIIQTQFSNLDKDKVKLSYEKLSIDKNIHYNIRLKNEDGSFDSLSLFLDEVDNFDSGKLFISKKSSNVWNQTTTEKYFIAQVGDREDGFIKIYNLDEGKFFIKNRDDSSITFVFASKLINGTYIAKLNGRHYDFKKEINVDIVEKINKENQETELFVKNQKDFIYEELAKIVKEDISLGSYTEEEALIEFPQLKEFIKNDIPTEQRQTNNQ